MVAEKIKAHPELCRDCQACMLVCSLYHDGENNPRLSRVQVSKDMANYVFDIHVCQHCDPPECMLVCPADAIRLNEQGVAILHFDDCIHCGACQDACPYQAIFYYQTMERYLKCDLCQGRSVGPACVQICPVGAIVLG
jgi:Fe-S-cluster-containing hydrogenase component 2